MRRLFRCCVALCFLARPAVVFAADRALAAEIGVLGRDDADNQRIIDHLAGDPRDAVEQLLQQLEPVPLSQLRPTDVRRHERASHVVWCLRAIRFLTHGKTFTAPTRYVFEERESARKQFLLDKGLGGEVPFFAVWMSRDVVYLAPSDAQEEIIKRWRRWYEVEGRTFRYERAESIDDWYF